MSQAPLLYSVEDGVACITLNRPENLNSFNNEMHAEMRKVLKAVRQDSSVRALLLTGNGRGFCAGQDLSDRSVAPGAEAPDLGESLEKRYNPMLRALKDMPFPTICAVNGVAAGAGANIALACDIVLAARSASFIQAFCKIGLIPDSGGTWNATFSALLGAAKITAKALALLWKNVAPPSRESDMPAILSTATISIISTGAINALTDSRLVIEAIVENLGAKRQVFARLEALYEESFHA